MDVLLLWSLLIWRFPHSPCRTTYCYTRMSLVIYSRMFQWAMTLFIVNDPDPNHYLPFLLPHKGQWDLVRRLFYFCRCVYWKYFKWHLFLLWPQVSYSLWEVLPNNMHCMDEINQVMKNWNMIYSSSPCYYNNKTIGTNWHLLAVSPIYHRAMSKVHIYYIIIKKNKHCCNKAEWDSYIIYFHSARNDNLTTFNLCIDCAVSILDAESSSSNELSVSISIYVDLSGMGIKRVAIVFHNI